MIATSELADVLELAPLLPGLVFPPLPPFPVVPSVVAVLPGWPPGVVVADVRVVVVLAVVVLPGVDCTLPLLFTTMGCCATNGPPETEPLAQR